MACHSLGRRDARRLGAGAGWVRRRDQSRGPQRQLPVYRREPRPPSSSPACCRRVSSDRRSRRPDIRLASGCRRARPRSIRTATMPRTTRRRVASAAGTGCAGRLDVQHRRRARVGARARGGHRPADTKSRPAVRHHSEPRRGGIFDTLLGLVRFGLGGTAGDGRQFISWVHYEDFVQAIRWLIDHEDVDGAVNIASPNPLPNAEFMRVLARGVGHAGLACRPSDGCWRSARSSCEPRRSSSSRAAASCRAGSSSAASSSSIRTGPMRRATSAGSGGWFVSADQRPSDLSERLISLDERRVLSGHPRHTVRFRPARRPLHPDWWTAVP